MVAREQHHKVDRRVLPSRRNDGERRLGERRLEVISLDEERRDQSERRRAIDRRQPTGRRQVAARGDKLVVLVVSDREDEARRVTCWTAPLRSVSASQRRRRRSRSAGWRGAELTSCSLPCRFPPAAASRPSRSSVP